MTTKALAIAMALIAATPAIAQTQNLTTGNEMLRHCNMVEQVLSGQTLSSSLLHTVDDAYKQGMCVGGVAGIMFLANAATKTTAHAICIPSTVSTAQSLTVVVRFLRNHPEKLNDAFASLVLDALREAWPCTKRQGDKQP
jgi:hypothetical protein